MEEQKPELLPQFEGSAAPPPERVTVRSPALALRVLVLNAINEAGCQDGTLSKRTRPRRGICAYCGETKPVAADHVPPKNLFRKPYPANLWTVPSCEDCNGGFSKDDEYFRRVLTLTEKAKGHPERDAVLPVAIRSLNNPRAERFQESLLAKVSLRHRFSPGGLYLGQQQAIAFDGRRIDRMASRIIKGPLL
jgi:hypothetical protein